MSLAIFDLDNTLLRGDSDYLWGEFLVQQGLVNGDNYRERNRQFYEQYEAGKLDILEFLAFSLRPLSEHSMDRLNQLHYNFMAQSIEPIILPAAEQLVESHRQQGHELMIITATNRFVTEPIAHRFGIENLIATEAEIIDNRYTGKVAGTPSYKDGKVTRLQQWMSVNNFDLDDSWFYSDSHNDIPLLNKVTHPVAVDPDEPLERHANENGWQVISLA